MTEATKDGYELHDDGSVSVTFAGKTATFPALKLGEYKTIRGYLDEVQRERTAKIEAGEESSYTDELDDATDVLVKIFTLLGADMGSPDDWPSWAVSGAFLGKLLLHWRAVPLAHGGK